MSKGQTNIVIIDKVYDKLTIKSVYNHPERYGVWVTCECSCNNKTLVNVPVYKLESGHTKSCGCNTRKAASNRWKGNKLGKQSFKGIGDIGKAYWTEILFNAQKRNLPVSITLEYIWNLFLQQDRKCALSGQSLVFASRRDYLNQTASLDRVNSKLGYIEGNVQWIHKDINHMKWDLDDYTFIKLCNLVINPIHNKDYKYQIQINNRAHKNSKASGYEDISSSFWYSIKYAATKRKHEFNIDIKDAWKLFIKQNGCCAITGQKLSFSPRPLVDRDNQTASLDRIDSSKGYIQDNIQWVHKNINKIKYKFDTNYFINSCKLIITYNNYFHDTSDSYSPFLAI